MRALRAAAVASASLLALFVLVGAASASLRTISVKEVVPGVPAWAVGAAVAFGVVVGGGFMAAQGAVRSRAAARGVGGEYAPDPRAPVTRALSTETAAFVAEEGVYKSALLKRLGAAGPPVPSMPGARRARYAPCSNCTTPVRYAPGETSAKCVKCGRTSTLALDDEDA